MNDVLEITRDNWNLFLASLLDEMNIFVPVNNGYSTEYKLFTSDLENVVYNRPIPVTPLKQFFLPVKENVVINKEIHNKKLIIGIPSCDLAGLDLLDEIYLDERFVDSAYKDNRDHTILIGTDCHDIRENCHCTSYGIEPYPESNADATLAAIDGKMIFTVKSDKGSALFDRCRKSFPVEKPGEAMLKQVQQKRKETKDKLAAQNQHLPDYAATGDLIKRSGEDIWIRHSSTCVSCGACATICPTCTCFLLIDRPDFEKVRQVDACQYPGFERIAAGEDPLRKKHVRFRNRYMCKYVWKPETFKSIACTGCGRCIDCCIGNISKNKIFLEMAANS
ncbi:MAG: 4Fe-4S dicluster domain-containing protein [Bacteroidales bacterium]|nr:4Fe-4S dicluster domain-containing protein [Bacteroidales bacterium]